MTLHGTVREYHADEGWGVIDAAETPGGCWVHFSAIAEPGYRALSPGQAVSFRAAPAHQDGYAHVAVKVWTGDEEPPEVVPEAVRSVAYESTLTLTLDAGPRTGPGGGTAA
ncbi:cold-shock protein [Actinoplanes sp. NPDC049599]|uniref:cold-shock protein n=1 Tax=Actinoplanes sp. NPDC049599 TaxID=3363903 RepID=UPI003790672D